MTDRVAEIGIETKTRDDEEKQALKNCDRQEERKSMHARVRSPYRTVKIGAPTESSAGEEGGHKQPTRDSDAVGETTHDGVRNEKDE